jgi:hypothetical protein
LGEEVAGVRHTDRDSIALARRFNPEGRTAGQPVPACRLAGPGRHRPAAHTAGHAVEPCTCGAYEYLIDRLAPRAVYLMHGNYGRENYWECAARLQKRGVRVEFPENEGDRFHFQQGACGGGLRLRPDP